MIRTARQMAAVAQRHQRSGKRVGFVPTMGALHEGHAALIHAARRECDVVVVSIFVNPLQFGPKEDYSRYPRKLPADLRLCRAAGADAAFTPSVQEIYPKGFATQVQVRGVTERWEGAHRPGHFDGVTTVVATLFNLVQPDRAYFGQKDYQQVLVIRQMTRDLRWPIEIRMRPTVRERDGLALSSRNAYLTPDQRREAPALHRMLQAGRRMIVSGERNAARLARQMRARLDGTAFRLQYLAIVDADTLEPVARVRGRTAFLVAARLGTTRLIDNILVGVP